MATLFEPAKADAKKPEFIDLRIEYLREVHSIPEDWKWRELQAGVQGHEEEVPVGLVRVRGYVPPHKKKDKLDTYWIDCEKFDAWCIQWEQRTGKCHRCTGAGQEFAGWSKASGTRYRECPRCKGDGKRPQA